MVVVWFRKDLRLTNNAALIAACSQYKQILPLYIYDEGLKIGGAQKVWLHYSLDRLSKSFKGKLMLKMGKRKEVIDSVVKEFQVKAVLWDKCHTPYAKARDAVIKQEQKKQGVEVEEFDDYLLFQPTEIKNLQGQFYKVFSPFFKACLRAPPPEEPVPKAEGFETLSFP